MEIPATAHRTLECYGRIHHPALRTYIGNLQECNELKELGFSELPHLLKYPKLDMDDLDDDRSEKMQTIVRGPWPNDDESKQVWLQSSLIETLVVGAVLEWPLASPDGDSSPLLSELGDGSTEPLWSHRDDYEIFQIPAMDFNLLSCAERFGFRKTQLAPILNQRRYGVFMEYRSTLAKKLSRLSKEELALCVPPSHRIETWDEAEDIKHMVDFLTQPRLSFRGASHDFGLSMVSDVFVALGDSPWVANNIGRKVKTIHVYATLPGRTAQVYDDSDVATRWCEQQKTDDYAWAPECKVMTEADTYLTEKGMFYRSSQQTLPLFEINYEWRPEKECQLNAYAMKVRALADDAVYANKHPERVTSSVL